MSSTYGGRTCRRSTAPRLPRNTPGSPAGPILPEERTSGVIEALVARLARAERVLISTPMWNFSIPYRLKHWIDLITQPALTFTFDPATGYAPLLTPRPTLVILASGGDYATGESRADPISRRHICGRRSVSSGSGHHRGVRSDRRWVPTRKRRLARRRRRCARRSAAS